MTATFAQFQAEQDARNTLQLNVTNWSLMLIDALEHDAPSGYRFEMVSGNKYYKIVMTDVNGNHHSVHCFINRKTGEVYKSASWSAPAKGVRYDLRIINQREAILADCDWAGSYLYR